MEYKQIQELIKSINKSNISELSIKDGDFEITIKQQQPESDTQFVHMQAAQMPMMMPQMQPPQQLQHSPLQPAQEGGGSASPFFATPPNAAPAAAPAEKGTTIKSPMIGTFYRSPSPDKPPFVNVGDEVKKGQVLCVIEAMKLFNEIECEMDGRLIKVIADDASPVEYDQPLFVIEAAA